MQEQQTTLSLKTNPSATNMTNMSMPRPLLKLRTGKSLLLHMMLQSMYPDLKMTPMLILRADMSRARMGNTTAMARALVMTARHVRIHITLVLADMTLRKRPCQIIPPAILDETAAATRSLSLLAGSMAPLDLRTLPARRATGA